MQITARQFMANEIDFKKKTLFTDDLSSIVQFYDSNLIIGG
jgi:hypothetical protein